ncbi:putative quinol monooxygenase [Flavobacterium agrisoli]|uniref:Antibiotic biosynthesis monooxygenase n=1 Tax=Flavobacterium agrisoli TaxID=2793066 RepID=A0A934UK19_9FLAO|nr:putative quinol monooxygenase [Flavobacterium agrisoli]MBK0370591.1 antibiotic biosynthesis monooxygenase [Flavobacterium agrisoli]
MITITAIISGKPEKNDILLPLLKHLVTQTRKESTCLRYDMHATETTYIIWEEWENQDGLDLHNQKPYLLDLIQKSDELTFSIKVYKTQFLF